MGVLSWIVVGLIAGWLASLVMKGRGFGLIGNIVIGIVGGLLGGFLASSLFKIANPVSGLNLTTVVVAFLGSVVLMALIRLLRRI
ncbi:MAG: GlsB/YeaQ/YmgE family stress response membrane protein [Anaerolineae bacterium]|nr:GlsB/YeaQ/YmgE family stress response membrane protein [Anaerolineae bacterium]